jgi:hypothetical protein
MAESKFYDNNDELDRVATPPTAHQRNFNLHHRPKVVSDLRHQEVFNLLQI